MSDSTDYFDLEALAIAMLKGCVELRKETRDLLSPERETAEIAGYARIAALRREVLKDTREVFAEFPTPHANALRVHLLANAVRFHGEEFATWLGGLLDRVPRSEPPGPGTKPPAADVGKPRGAVPVDEPIHPDMNAMAMGVLGAYVELHEKTRKLPSSEREAGENRELALLEESRIHLLQEMAVVLYPVVVHEEIIGERVLVYAEQLHGAGFATWLRALLARGHRTEPPASISRMRKDRKGKGK